MIGILGKQIAGEPDGNDGKATGICAAIRKSISAGDPKKWYGKMAPMFAKVVLYAQLCHEREVNNGESGELEKLLSTGSSIQENIENTAQRMAKDIVFKNVVLKKIGVEDDDRLIPNRYKFEALVASYGCRGIWMEYKQNLKDMGNQNEPQTVVGGKKMDTNQKAAGPKAVK